MKLQELQDWLHQGFTQYVNFFAVYLTIAILCLGLITTTGAEAAESSSNITVYRDPGCSCCGGWMDHLAAAGLHPENVPTAQVDALKQRYGVPDDFTSCHTAIIDGYVIEGHVPIADIKRLIAEHPHVVGLTVPGMPIGTPGMESDSEARDSFTVFSFDQQGNTQVFNQYSF